VLHQWFLKRFPYILLDKFKETRLRILRADIQRKKTDMTDLSDFATRNKTMSLNCILILFNVCEITVVLAVKLSLKKFCARYNW